MNNRILILLLTWMTCFLAASFSSADQVRVFQIQFRQAEDLLDPVKAVLSEKGGVTVDKRTNSLIVRDSSAGIRNVETLLATMDVAPVNVAVTVSRIGETEMENLGVAVQWARRDGRWAVGNLNKTSDGAYLGLTARKKVHSSSFAAARKLVLLSGSKGFWTDGNRVSLQGPQAGWSQTFGAWVKETGAAYVQPEFTLEPVVRGDQVMLTLTPGAALYSGASIEKRQYLQAQVTVTVPDGGAVLVGSDTQSPMSEVSEVLQGFSTTRAMSSSFLLIEVSILK